MDHRALISKPEAREHLVLVAVKALVELGEDGGCVRLRHGDCVIGDCECGPFWSSQCTGCVCAYIHTYIHTYIHIHIYIYILQ
jgi:hypothetical protein